MEIPFQTPGELRMLDTLAELVLSEDPLAEDDAYAVSTCTTLLTISFSDNTSWQWSMSVQSMNLQRDIPNLSGTPDLLRWNGHAGCLFNILP
jgi:hypothetical protein